MWLRNCKFFLISLWLCAAAVAFAQRYVIKPGATDGFLFRLRASGQTYMVANARIGQEALQAGMLSRVGVKPATIKERLQHQVYKLGQKYFPARLENLVKRRLADQPFPAHYLNFEKSWEQVHEQVNLSLHHLEVVLEAAYGEETTFGGAFVATFKQVLSYFGEQREMLSAQEALKRAYQQGLEEQNGFFVITVHATPTHAADVLLLDLKNQNFISVGKSMGSAWLEQHKPWPAGKY